MITAQEEIFIRTALLGSCWIKNTPFGNEPASFEEMRQFAEYFDKKEFLKHIDFCEKTRKEFGEEQFVNSKPNPYGKGLSELLRKK